MVLSLSDTVYGCGYGDVGVLRVSHGRDERADDGGGRDGQDAGPVDIGDGLANSDQGDQHLGAGLDCSLGRATPKGLTGVDHRASRVTVRPSRASLTALSMDARTWAASRP